MNQILPQPRALTRNEIKALREAGLDPAFLEGSLTIKINAEMVDWILDRIYSQYDFSDVAYPECLELCTRTYQLTYQANDDAVKNS